MKIADYDRVIGLWQKAEGLRLRQADSLDGIRRYLTRNPGLSFVAEHHGAGIVGTIMAGHDGKRGYLQHLTVAQAYRGIGVGSELTRRCLAALKVEGILKTHLFVLDENAAARRFWQNRGWQKRDDFSVYSFINSTEHDV
ncbi:GNAT family N-acetyltransferase [Allohahella marinimesophila]|uniref:GNAT family N-acetyltransferase n=2 Tax=Allohahella marinimesophila TaxID=1054972 RepID=A0ABP7PMU7_9GAMM